MRNTMTYNGWSNLETAAVYMKFESRFITRNENVVYNSLEDMSKAFEQLVRKSKWTLSEDILAKADFTEIASSFFC